MFSSFSKRLWKSIGACGLALAFFQLTAPAQAEPSVQNTHLLSIGICPPWKPQPASACEKSVEATGKGLTQRLGIPDQNWHKLLNEQATRKGLFEKLSDLSGILGPDDRLIIYANLHAGSLDPSKPAGPDNDVFVLWSEEKPEVMAFAVAQGLWIEAKTFAGRVHRIPAGEVIVVMDSCEAGAVAPLFIDIHPDDDETRPEAVVTSAEFNQFANMSSDGSMALYSEMLGNVLKTQNGLLSDALSKAASLTETAAVPICKKQADALKKYGQASNACNQQPATHDPQNILSKLQLNAL
ncbi:hypothetical protein [Roseibium sp.]|uniref:hypothetical protein n=1 Tax=Roseibium sp. TaxID=1936156 RepID=UPI003A97A476